MAPKGPTWQPCVESPWYLRCMMCLSNSVTITNFQEKNFPCSRVVPRQTASIVLLMHFTPCLTCSRRIVKCCNHAQKRSCKKQPTRVRFVPNTPNVVALLVWSRLIICLCYCQTFARNRRREPGLFNGGHGPHQRTGRRWSDSLPVRTLPYCYEHHTQNASVRFCFFFRNFFILPIFLNVQ